VRELAAGAHAISPTKLAESTGSSCQLFITDKQNPTAVAAPASDPPRSNEKGISEFVSIASRPPAAGAAETAARLSPKAKRWLAELYQILAVTPLPGQSDLDVQPHPWVSNIYTVPFLDGHLVYAMLEWKGLVGILRYEP
jgi:hypothetical protein